jgi:F0F1-type ATP synthase assembly protein I
MLDNLRLIVVGAGIGYFLAHIAVAVMLGRM